VTRASAKCAGIVRRRTICTSAHDRIKVAIARCNKCTLIEKLNDSCGRVLARATSRNWRLYCCRYRPALRLDARTKHWHLYRYRKFLFTCSPSKTPSEYAFVRKVCKNSFRLFIQTFSIHWKNLFKFILLYLWDIMFIMFEINLYLNTAFLIKKIILFLAINKIHFTKIFVYFVITIKFFYNQ